MNEVLAQRAWEKALKEDDLSLRDWIKGAVCYYRGFSNAGGSSAAIIAKDVERGLRGYVAANNLTELDDALKRRLNKVRHERVPMTNQQAAQEIIDQHWAHLTGTVLENPIKPPKQEKVGFHDKDTGVRTAMVSTKDLHINKSKFHESFDDDTMARIRRVYEALPGAHWETFEECVAGFQCDMNPYSEIGIYERMAEAYQTFFKIIALAPAMEQEDTKQLQYLAYTTLLTFTMGRSENLFGLPDELYAMLGHLYLMDAIGIGLTEQANTLSRDANNG